MNKTLQERKAEAWQAYVKAWEARDEAREADEARENDEAREAFQAKCKEIDEQEEK